MLPSLHLALRIVHVAVGGAGLILFWIPVFTTKGSRWHVRSGYLFATCAYIVSISGIVSSVWALVDLPSFAATYANTLPEIDGETERLLTFLFAVLGYLSVAVLEGVEFGLAAARFRRRNDRLRVFRYQFTIVGLMTAAAMLALFGASQFIAQGMLRAEQRSTYMGLYPIAVVVGLLGLYGGWRHIRYVRGPRPTLAQWQLEHARNMLGLGTGFYTAFAVFGFNRLAPGLLTGWHSLLPWIVVPAVGVIGSELWLKSLEKSFATRDNAGQERGYERGASSTNSELVTDDDLL